MSLLHETAVFLIAAIIAVPLFSRLGFGSVLGYLAAGLVIGPSGVALITQVDHILHFAELGVVFLLFIIGLELQPSRLWVLRRSVFGLGLAQVGMTAAILGAIGYALGLHGETALIAGLSLALSSTAFVLQMLAEKKQLTTHHGRAAFSILLFQDLAVIPVLALVPLLSTGTTLSGDTNLLTQMGKAAIVMVGLVVGGRYVLRYLFRLIASTGAHEIFTGAALLVVVGTALLMEFAGLSMALGAFVAGMLLADSEYRHELEANIEPFKRLLLGLFFISVGMSANIALLISDPVSVLALAFGLLAVKFAVLLVLGRLFNLGKECAQNVAFVLPQGGEFAFVILGSAVAHQVMDRDLANLLVVVVTLTMAATPLLVLFNERVVQPWLQPRMVQPFDSIDDDEHQVIIAGFGRFGQVIGRLLHMKRIRFTAIESNVEQVNVVRRYGNKVYYGDLTRLDMLRAARVDKAKVFVLAVNDIGASVRTAELVRKHFPHVQIYARARNRHHAHLLLNVGVKYFIRETWLSALEMGRQVLKGLGESDAQSQHAVSTFQRHDEETLAKQLAIHHDEQELIQSAREAAKELEELFKSDAVSGDIANEAAKD